MQVIHTLHDTALQEKMRDSSIKHYRPAALFFNVCWRTVDNIVAELPEKCAVNELFSPNTFADEVRLLLPLCPFFFFVCCCHSFHENPTKDASRRSQGIPPTSSTNVSKIKSKAFTITTCEQLWRPCSSHMCKSQRLYPSPLAFNQKAELPSHRIPSNWLPLCYEGNIPLSRQGLQYQYGLHCL